MVAVWILICLIFPPIIPFVIVGALISIACKKNGSAMQPTSNALCVRNNEWLGAAIIIGLVTILAGGMLILSSLT